MAEHNGPGVRGNTVTFAATVAAVFVPAATYPRTVFIQNVGAQPIEIRSSDRTNNQSSSRLIANGAAWRLDLMPLQELWGYVHSTGSEGRYLVIDGV